MNSLFIMALQLEGGPQYEADGSLSKEQTKRIEEYARAKFVELGDEWEQKMGAKITVILIGEEEEEEG
jgi:hypothetical protein